MWLSHCFSCHCWLYRQIAAMNLSRWWVGISLMHFSPDRSLSKWMIIRFVRDKRHGNTQYEPTVEQFSTKEKSRGKPWIKLGVSWSIGNDATLPLSQAAGLYVDFCFLLVLEPIESNGLPTDCWPHTCPPTELKDIPTSIGVAYGQHLEFSSCWLSRPGFSQLISS